MGDVVKTAALLPQRALARARALWRWFFYIESPHEREQRRRRKLVRQYELSNRDYVSRGWMQIIGYLDDDE